MSPDLEIRAKLRSVAGRLRLLVLERRLSWCLLPGLVAALLILAAHKLDRLDEPYIPMALAVGLPLLVGLVWGFLKPISLLDAATAADRRLGLKERMANAVIFSAQPETSPLVPAIIEDASRHLSSVSPHEVLPHRMTRTNWWSLGVLALIGAAWFAPEYALGRSSEDVAARKEMREQGKKLEKVAERVKEEAQAKNIESAAELAAKLEKLAKELEKAKLSKKEALLKTGKLASEVREAQKLAALAAGAGAMGKASDALKSVPMASEAGQGLARAVHEQKSRELAQKLEQVAKDLREGKLSEEEKKKLAGDLQQMADALSAGGMDGAASAAQAAAEALAKGDAAAAADALQAAAQDAASAAEQAAANESLEEMANALEESQQGVAQSGQSQQCGTCATQHSPGGG